MSTICFTAWVYAGHDPHVLADISPWVSSGNLSAHPSVNCYANAPSTGAVLCDVSVNVLRPDLAVNVAGTLGRNTSGGVAITFPRVCYTGPPLNATYYALTWLMPVAPVPDIQFNIAAIVIMVLGAAALLAVVMFTVYMCHRNARPAHAHEAQPLLV